jgi:Na+/proline symporter
MPKREFVGTLVTTNIGFFSSVAFSTLLISTLGIGPAVLCVVSWFLGLWLFSRAIPRLLPFLKTGSTIHEFIAISYARTPLQAGRLALISSIITFVLYIASVGVEIKYASDVFSGVTGVPARTLALALCISGIFYVALAGYRGVVSTDRLRMWAVLLGVLAIFSFIFLYAGMEPVAWPSDYFSLKMLTIGRSPESLLSIIVLLALYQYCVMDMWERCIAIANSPPETDAAEINSLLTHDDQVVRMMQRMITRDALIPFILLFSAWYSIGLLSVAQSWTSDPAAIIPSFFEKIEILSLTMPLEARIIQMLVILCFLSAALSTIDGFLIAAVQTVVFDWMGYRPSVIDGAEAERRDRRGMRWSRFFILAFGTLSATIAFLTFDMMSFWVGMYSLMLAFFPPIFFALYNPERCRKVEPWIIGLAILFGSGCALMIGVFSTFVYPSALGSALATLASVGGSALVVAAGYYARR